MDLCTSTVEQEDVVVPGDDWCGWKQLRAGGGCLTPKLSSDFWLRLNCPAVAFGDTLTVVFSQLGEMCC